MLVCSQVTRQQLGKGGVPYLATHDGRTIRYPDPEIRVSPCLTPLCGKSHPGSVSRLVYCQTR